jgi:hypothetical protein
MNMRLGPIIEEDLVARGLSRLHRDCNARVGESRNQPNRLSSRVAL